MRLEFGFIFSTLLHIAFAVLLVILPELIQSGAGAEKVEIEIVQSKPKASGNLILPSGGRKKEKGPGPGKPSDDEQDEDGKRLEKQLTITNYIERVKSIVDPIWYGMVRERLDQLRRRGERINPLMVEVTVRVSPNGEILSRSITKSSGRRDFDNYATRAFDIAGQLPPPPKNLLENNVLVLFWDFTVNKH